MVRLFKNLFRRWVLIAACIASCLCLLHSTVLVPNIAHALEASNLIAQGECGECSWTLSDSGELVIAAKEGTSGRLPDLSNNLNNGYGDAPWDDYRDEILSARFEGRVVATRGYRTNDIGGMFADSRNLESLDLNGFSLGEVTKLDGAFSGCDSLRFVDLSPLDVSGVDTAFEIFQGCKRLNSFVLGDDWRARGYLFAEDDESYWLYEFDNVAYSHRGIPEHRPGAFKRGRPGFIFDQWYSQGSCKWSVDSSGTLCIAPLDGVRGALGQWCHSDGWGWESHRIPGWCTPSIRSRIKKVACAGLVVVDTCENMFRNLTHLREVNWSGFDFSNVSSLNSMFEGCRGLQELTFPAMSSTDAVEASSLFYGCSSLASVDLRRLSGTCLSSADSMFEGCVSLNVLQVVDALFDKAESIERMFAGCSSLRSIDLSSNSFPSATSTLEAFEGCDELETVDFAPGSFKNADSFRAMFSECTALVSPGVDCIDFSSADDLGYLFAGCSSLASLDLSVLSTCYPSQIEAMFSDCPALRSIDLSSLQPLYINSIDSLFSGCSSLQAIDLSVFDGCQLMCAREAFSGCSSLVEVKLPRIEYAQIGRSFELDGLFEGCRSLASISLEPLRILDGSFASFDALCSGCTSLKYADISTLADEGDDNWIESAVFEGCDSLSEVVVGNRIGMSEGWKHSILPHGYWEDVVSGAIYSSIEVPSYQMGHYRRVNAVQFADVFSGTPHNEHIQWLARKGISKGWDNGNGTFSFRPYAIVARADMAAFLYRLAGEPAFDESSAPRFIDVDAWTPHRRAILWLASTGISKGWNNGNGTFSFRPYANVVRADMAAFLYRLAGEPAFDESSVPGFADVSASTPHRRAILWLASSGVSKGWDEPNGTKTFRPYLEVARCDMAAFLHRMEQNGLVNKR